MNAYNYISGNEYTGGNATKLNAAGGGAWLTWKQMQSLGFRIRKGSHGVKITYKNNNYWVFAVKDCTLNGEPVVIEKPAKPEEEKPAVIPEPVKVPEIVKVPEPVKADRTWSLNDGIITLHPVPTATGKFNVHAVVNMTVASVKDFKKKWLSDDPDLLKIFIDEINRCKPESAEQKKIIFGGKPEKVDPEVSKIIKYITKQPKFAVKKIDDKYILTDSYMLIECNTADMEKLAEQIPSLLTLKEQNRLDNAWCTKNGKIYDVRDCHDMKNPTEGVDWNADTVVDFSHSLKDENKLYESSGVWASAKMIDLFKEKIFRSSGCMRPLTRVTNSYRAMVCPCRNYA